MITVVALGPGDPQFLTEAARSALQSTEFLITETLQHPALPAGVQAHSLDTLYENAADFDAFIALAVEEILLHENATFAVADPATNTVVAALIAAKASVHFVASVSHAEYALLTAYSRGCPVAPSTIVTTASDIAHAIIHPDATLVFVEISSRISAGALKIRLLDIYPADWIVYLSGKSTPLEAIDRAALYNHTTTLVVPACPREARMRYTFDDLLRIMARLRRPGDGCPWDLEQTHTTLKQFLIEEAYEVADAVDNPDPMALADELGDALLQVVFHAQIAEQHAEFDILDVTTAIAKKMVDRHVHIFGDVKIDTAKDVLKSWEQIKRKEKGLSTASASMRDIPRHFPALMRAYKVASKAERGGVALPPLPDGQTPDAVGDALFALANIARQLGHQPELLLNDATDRYIKRLEKEGL